MNSTLLKIAMAQIALAGAVHASTLEFRYVDLGWDGGHAADINDLNQIVGFSSRNATLWADGASQYLGTLEGGEYSYASAINNLGQVVGHVQMARGSRAVSWRDGKIQEIEYPAPLHSSVATAINDDGWVAGYVSPDDRTPAHAVVWRGGIAKNLNAAISYAQDVNNSGTIVGSSIKGHVESYSISAVAWDEHGVTDLEGQHFALAINDAGQVAGETLIPWTAIQHASVWNGASTKDLGTLPGGLNSSAQDINNHGLIVGWSDTSIYTQTDAKHATLWDESGIVDLNTLLDADVAAEWVLYEATGVNENGWIVGTAMSRPRGDAATIYRAFALIPTSVPEPGVLVMAAAGLLVLGFRQKLQEVRVGIVGGLVKDGRSAGR